MTLSKTITPIMPTESQLGVHLKLTDDDHPITEGTVVVIDEDVTDGFSIHAGPKTENQTEVARKVQKRINLYKKCKALCNDDKYTSAVTWVDENTSV